MVFLWFSPLSCGFPMGKPPFSSGKPIIVSRFLWFSHGFLHFPMVFPWFFWCFPIPIRSRPVSQNAALRSNSTPCQALTAEHLGRPQLSVNGGSAAGEFAGPVIFCEWNIVYYSLMGFYWILWDFI